MPIIFENCKAIDNKGDGFLIDASADVRLINAEAKKNGGAGFRISIPGTNITVTPEDLEAAKEIIKTKPEAEWSNRISNLKSIVDIGAAAAPYIPVFIQFIRGLFG